MQGSNLLKGAKNEEYGTDPLAFQWYPNPEGYQLHQNFIHLRQAFPREQGKSGNSLRQTPTKGCSHIDDQFRKRAR